jgi:hypothetical protein
MRELGDGLYLRQDYPFAIPTSAGVEEKIADAAIFSSQLASMHTAVVGLTDITDLGDKEPFDPSPYTFLGAPHLLARRQHRVERYSLSGSSEATKKSELSDVADADSWIREEVVPEVSPTQISFSFARGRDLLVQETKSALSDEVKDLLRRGKEEEGLDNTTAFRVAIDSIRKAWIGESHIEETKIKKIVKKFSSIVYERISFANVPPESIAEIYESLAIEEETKRRRGVYYTPAWLARYVVSRLPNKAFREGKAVDPTCGSGTFLICFLERALETRSEDGESRYFNASEIIRGIDKDPVAIETARLSLDLFAKSADIDVTGWNLDLDDATETDIHERWIIGNLPFGHRTSEGNKDISSVILSNIISEESVERVSIILPDSMAYKRTYSKTRKKIRSNFRIEEITRLPEKAFKTSDAKTIVLSAFRDGSRNEVVVKEIDRKSIEAFKSSVYTSNSYISRLPDSNSDPWSLSPFSNLLYRADNIGKELGCISQVKMGLQIYGVQDEVLSFEGGGEGYPLLRDPGKFAKWSGLDSADLPRLVGERNDVRRPGPWSLCNDEKIIIRVTTTPDSSDRLAAIPDTESVWFTDKFAGIWIEHEHIDICGLAAYLQSRFARIWFSTYNPSRKLRVSTLKKLPVPPLRKEWWSRASNLVPSGEVVYPPSRESQLELTQKQVKWEEWESFNKAVESSFEIDPVVSEELREWISE